jgi:hypothetical protein
MNKQNTKKATLVLKTSDLLSVSNNNVLNGSIFSSKYGSFNKQLSSFTWNNINLRALLGDMYDMYDEFNLCLNQISTSSLPPDAIVDNRSCYINMAGLQWVNQTYDFKTGNNGTMATIGTFTFGLSGSNTRSQFFNDSYLTFRKEPKEQCNLTIEYSRIVDNIVPPAPLNVLGALIISGSAGSNTVTVSNTTLSPSLVGMILTAAGVPSNSVVLYITGAGPYNVTLSNTLPITITNVTGGIMSSVFPNAIFMFDIYGIPKNDVNKK